MPWPLTRRRAISLGLGLLVVAGAVGVGLKLRKDLRGALEGPLSASTPLTFAVLNAPATVPEHWGGGEVEGVALLDSGLLTAGGFGVMEEGKDLSPGLPTLRASALARWRGHGVVGLASGGLFLRRNAQWEELRSGYGTLHVRVLMEGVGGELWIGAREGLYRVAWGARTLFRIHGAPVKSLALGNASSLYAGGEEGLIHVDGAHIDRVVTPDPWVEWVGVSEKDLLVLTPMGLARGPVGGTLMPIPGADEVSSATVVGGETLAISQGRLLRFEASGRAAEAFLPAAPRRLFEVEGQVFVDTTEGLYRRAKESWRLAQPRPRSLPPGPSHVNALSLAGSRIALGLFNGGVVFGEPQGKQWQWSALPGTEAWGVNALLNAGGTLYVASLRGASRFDGRKLEPLETKDTGAAFSLSPTQGGVAVGYGQGVSLPGSRFLSAFHGLPGNQALALLSKEQLFVGTPTGLGAVSGSKVLWRVVAGDGKLPHPWVTALASMKDVLYVGTYGGGVTRRTALSAEPNSPGLFDPFVETEGLKVNTGCLIEAGGRLWLGTDGRGLYRLSSDGRRFLPVRVSLPSPRVTALLPDKDGLFVGTDEGLARISLSIPDEG